MFVLVSHNDANRAIPLFRVRGTIAANPRAWPHSRIELLLSNRDVVRHTRASLIKENFSKLLSRLVEQHEGVSSSSGRTAVLAGVPNGMQKVRWKTEFQQSTTQELGLGFTVADVDLGDGLLHSFSMGLC